MIKSMKRMVLTGAAVAVMMSIAAPAMALPKVVDGGPSVIGPVVDPPEPPDPDPLCDVRPFGCGNTPDPVLDPGDNPVADPDPLCEVRPYGCGNNPDPVLDPGTNDPVTDPPDEEDPVADPPDQEDPVTDPPDKEDPVADPPDNNDPVNEDSDPSGPGDSSGGSSGGIDSAGETIDQGGTFVSGFLPTALTNAIGDAGNSIKKNLPSPVAESLPNTGGGWSFLVLVAVGLIAVGLVIGSVAKRTTSITRTAQ